jgi:hypothetical protein
MLKAHPRYASASKPRLTHVILGRLRLDLSGNRVLSCRESVECMPPHRTHANY